MRDRCILTLNVGSSSVKYGVFLADVGDRIKGGEIGKIEDLLSIVNELDVEVVAVGHRVVHGGGVYSAPVVVTDNILGELRGFTGLAPLHQPNNIRGIEWCIENFRGAKNVACFDTAFHSTMPAENYTYAVSKKMHDMGIRKYGFHGLSYAYVSEFLIRDRYSNYIVAHLGSGASLCHIVDGKSVNTSMGMTALGGIVMGTRCGDIDPGVILYMLQELDMTAKEIENELYRCSGVMGLSSGHSPSMKDLPDTSPIIDMYATSVAQGIARLMVSHDSRLEAIVFTAGVGENSKVIRDKILHKLRFVLPNDIQIEVVHTDEEKYISEKVLTFIEPDLSI